MAERQRLARASRTPRSRANHRLTSRVLCIAVCDALTAERNYKQPLSHDEAMEIMRSDGGRAFEPALFGSFEEIVWRGTWRRTSAGMPASVSV